MTEQEEIQQIAQALCEAGWAVHLSPVKTAEGLRWYAEASDCDANGSGEEREVETGLHEHAVNGWRELKAKCSPQSARLDVLHLDRILNLCM